MSRYIYDFQVVYAEEASKEPSNAITDINGGCDDINHGFGGKYVFLVPMCTDDPSVAATSFKIVIQSERDYDRDDIAWGAGGDYRYVIPMQDPHNPDKVIEAKLLRSGASTQYPPSGWDGITSNINEGRGGDYLYIIWRSGL
ncbi:hypothetical protein VNI00_012892 [Paramarasmius palmivorus]|uniref:Uncharacterized protein n=1 Tax=Paramarasmius palmivorus TaxID=297713 RepID=A0AAW0C0E8_9AGAR